LINCHVILEFSEAVCAAHKHTCSLAQLAVLSSKIYISQSITSMARTLTLSHSVARFVCKAPLMKKSGDGLRLEEKNSFRVVFPELNSLTITQTTCF